MQNERNLTCIPDEQLLATLEGVYRSERLRVAEFLRILGEVDARKLYLERGFPSLFAFCQEGFGMSEDQAYRRVAAARAGRKFPRVLRMVSRGELHMTGASKLAKHLTDENHVGLLDAARGKTKAEIERLIAARFPVAAAKTWIQRQPRPASVPGTSTALLAEARLEARLEVNGSTDVHDRVPPAARPHLAPGAASALGKSSALFDRVSPTSAEVFTFRFAGSAKAKALLDRAQALLGPEAEVGQVVEMALEGLVKQLERKKFKTTEKPRAPRQTDAPSGKRYVPAAVRRAVYVRDEGRCKYVSEQGRRCSATSNLEFDHATCVARGGRRKHGRKCPAQMPRPQPVRGGSGLWAEVHG